MTWCSPIIRSARCRSWCARDKRRCSTGIAVRWETVRRPEHLRYAPLRDGYIQRLTASYDWLERNLDSDTPVHVGHIALASCLSWLDFTQLSPFREGHARLTSWYEEFVTRASMRATTLCGETRD
jgi:hypothetical protein